MRRLDAIVVIACDLALPCIRATQASRHARRRNAPQHKLRRAVDVAVDATGQLVLGRIEALRARLEVDHAVVRRNALRIRRHARAQGRRVRMVALERLVDLPADRLPGSLRDELVRVAVE